MGQEVSKGTSLNRSSGEGSPSKQIWLDPGRFNWIGLNRIKGGGSPSAQVWTDPGSFKWRILKRSAVVILIPSEQTDGQTHTTENIISRNRLLMDLRHPSALKFCWYTTAYHYCFVWICVYLSICLPSACLHDCIILSLLNLIPFIHLQTDALTIILSIPLRSPSQRNQNPSYLSPHYYFILIQHGRLST